jgi:hypothetical protein
VNADSVLAAITRGGEGGQRVVSTGTSFKDDDFNSVNLKMLCILLLYNCRLYSWKIGRKCKPNLGLRRIKNRPFLAMIFSNGRLLI